MLAVQHVLVMYAGAVAVSLILGGALKLPREQVALLINADLLDSGILLASARAVALNAFFNGGGPVLQTTMAMVEHV